jgi:hypothetical protein
MLKTKPYEKYFSSTNFYFASFLFAKGFELVNVDKITNPKKARFVFANSPEIEDLQEIFTLGKSDSPEIMVDAKRFVMAIKSLKDQLYSENF